VATSEDAAREPGSGGLLAGDLDAAVVGGVSSVALAIPPSLRKRAEIERARGRGWLLHRMLLTADVLGLTFAFFIAELLFQPAAGTPYAVSPALQWIVFLASLPIWVAIAQLSGLYGRDGQRADHSTVDDFVGIFSVITIGSWLYSAVAWVTHAVKLNPPRMLTFWLVAIGLVVCGRAAARALARRSPMFTQNAVIVGAGSVGQLIARKLQQHPEYAIRLVGFVDDELREQRSDIDDIRLLAPTSRLPELVETYDIDRVIVAFSSDPDNELLKTIHQLKAISVQIDLVPRLFEAVGPRVDMHTVEALPLIGLPPVRLSPAARTVKRLFDILVAGVVLLVTAPLFAYAAWRIRRDSPGPVLFRQKRLGLNMKEFTVLKFRTMRVGVDNDVHREYIKSTMSATAPIGGNGMYKLERPGDITPFGRWLRKTSIDELPQLINVLRGEMSLVGPRPCIAYETEHFQPHHFERFLVQPGLTGLWQVTARARASFGEALDMDVAYARSWSLGLDLRLLCRTPLALLRQRSTA
jgi:exopolysaccharide biosynthesis polyprenyl glycosylphosphotransferase